MTTVSDLAARLRALPDNELTELLVARHATDDRRVHDFFDLADLLRTPDSIDRALERLPRATIAAITDARATPSALLQPARQLMLVAPNGEVDDAVAARIAERQDLHDIHADDTRPSSYPPPAEKPADDRARAAEHAFTTMTVIAELLREVERGTVHELARGGIGIPLARDLGARVNAPPEEVQRLLDFAARTRLVDAVHAPWSLSEEGVDWLHENWPDRWVHLVRRWHSSLDAPVVATLREAATDWRALPDVGGWLFPAGGTVIANACAQAAADADAIGITVDGVLTVTGRGILDSTEPAEAVALAASALPATVSQVYLQHDLTAIAPGPLSPEDDSALRAIAEVESPGLVTRYRITEESVRGALQDGNDSESILATLRRLSAADLPQPVLYLVSQVAARGTVTLDESPAGGTTVSGPAALLEIIAVDRELRSFAWTRSTATQLQSRRSPSVVAEALQQRRYPIASRPTARHAHEHKPAPERTPTSPKSRALDVVNRIRHSPGADTDFEHAWISRRINLAVGGKAALTMRVRMPDGSESAVSMIPTAIAAGRVRGRDIAADIERTLPLSAIVSVDEA